MENRLQHILLSAVLSTATLMSAVGAQAELRTNDELFDIGLITGVINIEDFPSEFAWGANITFKASESFFLQYNYLEADIPESSFEQAASFALDDRQYTHYDLLVGYNIFQGEFFVGEGKAHLSTLYVVGGAGETNFGGEDNFSYTVGLGYQVEFHRKYLFRVDYRNHLYETAVLGGGDENTVNNTQFSVGLGYLF